MLMTITGVAVVILTREEGGRQLKHPIKGIICAFLGMLGQALGLVLSKYGMGDYNAFSATQIRIIAGMIGFTLLCFHFKAWGQFAASFLNRPAITALLVGTVFGPFLGVYLSLVAIQNTSTAVASTIISIVPILIIPCAVLLFKERVSLREIAGAVVGVAGTCIMFA